MKAKCKELVRSAIAARSRPLTSHEVGQRCFFYRPYPSDRAKRLNSGDVLGPATIFGKKDGNLWVEYGGRPYLCAPEHLRGLSVEEGALEEPSLQQSLKEIRQVAAEEEFEDLIGVNATGDEVDQAV